MFSTSHTKRSVGWLVVALSGGAMFMATLTTVTHAESDGSKSSDPIDASVLFVLTSHEKLGDTGVKTGFYLSEVSHVYYVLREAGIDVRMASIAGGKPPMDGTDVEDELNERLLADEAAMAALASTTPLAKIDPSEFDAVYFPGGHGTMWDFPGNPDVERVTRAVWESDGIVAAVCHGPAALVDVRLSDGSYLVAGREVATFTDSEESAVELAEVVPFLLQTRLEERGAEVRVADDFEANVVVSDRLITGQNPASAHEAAVAIVEALKKRADAS